MATLFAKARIAVLSVANSLIDKVIDLNSVEAVKQHTRDLERSRDQLQNSVAEARGHVTGLKRDIVQTKTRESKLNRNIDLLLTDQDPNNDHHAKTMEAELNGLEKLRTSKEEELSAANQTVQGLEEALSALSAKHEAMVQQIANLEALDRSAKAKEKAATALRNASKVGASGADVSVDNVAAQIQRRSDVADEKFKAAMGDFATVTERDSALGEVEARLAARKARLAANKQTS